jgi:beta-glucosidase
VSAPTLPRPTAPAAVEQRVDALLARLRLEEKLGQMLMGERASTTPDDVRAYHIGAVLSGSGSVPGANTPADWVALNDALWAASTDTTDGRTPIPLLYAVDAVHGHANVRGATIFPHHIGLGAARDPELIERLARVCAREVLATGLDWNFAPTLAVVQNVQWGRTYESFSDDPALVAAYAEAFVRGMQGTLDDDGVLACAKHWIGDGATSEGIDQGDSVLSPETLERTHLPPYLAALRAGVQTVMVSFNSVNGLKCHAHHELLTGLLKGRLGFTGLVVSDWDGVDQVADDLDEAIVLAVNAGVDMIMCAADWKRRLAGLSAGVASGQIPMARIDDAVRRILRVKVRAGLLDRVRPAERPWAESDTFGGATHRAVARDAVRKSLVLLKHEGGVLPLRPAQRILVAGKHADDVSHQCGGFSAAWQGTHGNDAIVGGTSIWQAIRAVAPDATLSVDGAAADASQHDVAVVVIGEMPYAEGMGDIRPGGRITPPLPGGLRTVNLEPYGTTLELAVRHPEDLATIEAIRAKGIPVVTVLLSGRPLLVDRELAASDAFIAAWLPGSEGAGVVDVLVGAHDATGVLPLAWPATGPAPDGSAPARFPRGYGLTFR